MENTMFGHVMFLAPMDVKPKNENELFFRGSLRGIIEKGSTCLVATKFIGMHRHYYIYNMKNPKTQQNYKVESVRYNKRLEVTKIVFDKKIKTIVSHEDWPTNLRVRVLPCCNGG